MWASEERLSMALAACFASDVVAVLALGVVEVVGVLALGVVDRFDGEEGVTSRLKVTVGGTKRTLPPFGSYKVEKSLREVVPLRGEDDE